MTNSKYYDYANIFKIIKNEDNFEYYNLYNSINFDGEPDPTLYTKDMVYDFSSWYSLSYKHYGTTELWWLLLVFNSIKNPFDITPGQVIKVPNKNTVSEILSQIDTSL